MLLNRRDALIGLGRLTLGGVTLPGLLKTERAAAQAKSNSPRARARSCIVVFLWGGPPHQDMWDMKPDAPQGIRSLFKPISTNVPGIQYCEHLPLLAQQADKLAIIRSMTHKSDVHESSVYHMLTGKVDSTLVVPRNQRKRIHAPGIGAVVSCLTESGNLPTSVTVPRPIQHDGVKYAGTHAGFLGPQFDPMELPDTPMVNGRPVLDLDLLPEVDAGRVSRRRGLLDLIESGDRHLQTSKETHGIDAFRQRAFRMISSAEARRAFHLGLEPDPIRERYGRNHYCEAFLLARRLVEAGVRLVTVNWMFFRPDGNPLNPWDNHGGTPALGSLSGFDMLKAEYCLPSLDRALSALLEDLSQRGLLDETLVVVMGEFGRTPKINGTMGRDHWGACFSVLLAGAGIRGGVVYGASDSQAAYPSDRPVRPEDLLATVYGAFGIPAGTEVLDLENRPHRVSEGEAIQELFG